MLSHRDTETQSRKRKGAFSAISFPLFLCVSVSLWLTAIRNPQSAIRDRLRGRGALLTGAGFLMFFCMIAVLADLLSPYDYSSLSRREPLAPPTTIRFREIGRRRVGHA